MRTSFSLALAAALLAATALVPALGQANRPDKQAREAKKARDAAWAAVEAKLKDPNTPIEEAIDTIDAFQDQLDFDTAMKLLGFFDECDMAWSSKRKDKLGRPIPGQRPVESYKVAKAILKAVRNMKSADEVLKFEPEVEMRGSHTLRVRTAMMDAIANNFTDKRCSDLLITFAKDESRDTDMRILAIFHLRDYPRTVGVIETLLLTLRDRSWRVRDASVAALIPAAEYHEERVTIALINALANEQGKLRQIVALALDRIHGVSIGVDPDAWIDWYKNKKRDAQGLPAKQNQPGRGTRSIVFETETFSDRYVFVIDTSISMLKKITPDEMEKLKRSITDSPGEQKDLRRPLDWSKINTKLDLAREEIIRSLEVMDPKVTRFTMVKFDVESAVWKEELVPTDVKNVIEATDWLRAIKGGNRTNVYGALNAALDLSEVLAGIDVAKRRPKPREKDGKVITGPHRDEALPDTLFIYTDGYATNGKYMGGDDRTWAGKSQSEKATLYGGIMKYMLDELEDRNRISRITINTIGVGNPQDHTTLGALARRCGGKYVPLGYR